MHCPDDGTLLINVYTLRERVTMEAYRGSDKHTSGHGLRLRRPVWSNERVMGRVEVDVH